MIDILAHRGIWDKNIEPNSLGALSNSIKSGFGIETDLRDHEGRIVISHDMPRTPVLLFEDFLNEYCQLIKPSNNQQYLALNIKSDGLQFEIKRILSEFKIDKYFVFDMSIPDTIPYIKNNWNVIEKNARPHNLHELDPMQTTCAPHTFDSTTVRRATEASFRRLQFKPYA